MQKRKVVSEKVREGREGEKKRDKIWEAQVAGLQTFQDQLTEVHEIKVEDGTFQIYEMMTATILDMSGSIFFPSEIQTPLSASAIFDAIVGLSSPVTTGTTIDESVA